MALGLGSGLGGAHWIGSFPHGQVIAIHLPESLAFPSFVFDSSLCATTHFSVPTDFVLALAVDLVFDSYFAPRTHQGRTRCY